VRILTETAILGADVSAESALLDSRFGALAGPIRAYEERAPGQLGIAAAPVNDGGVLTCGTLQGGRAWSLIKVPLLAAFLAWRRSTKEASDGASLLSRQERRLAEDAIERSSNLAARRLFAIMAIDLGLDGARHELQRIMEAAGDTETTVAATVDPATGVTSLGTTEWGLVEALRFFRHLARGRLLSPSDTAYVLDLMRRVSPPDRWGIADAVPPTAPLAFKGGWGPEPDLRWLVRQVAVVGEGDSASVLAVMVKPDLRAPTRADLRSFEAGKRLLRATAEIVTNRLGPFA
jgi:hypothetical protein